MKLQFTLTILVCYSISYSQSFSDTSYNHHTLTDPKLKTFEIHVTKSNSQKSKPVLVYIDGSGNLPLYYKTKSGKYATSISLNIKQYARDYHVVLISKPNIPFSDTVQYSPSGRMFYPANERYTQLYSLDWRAETASKAIDYVIKKYSVDTRKIIVMGYSEGAQVAPKIAVLNKKVTNVVCFVGNALNQLYDFLLEARLDADRKIISPVEAQKMVDSLYLEYEKIYADPTATNKTWYGETYLKWSSFSRTTPLENMLKLTIPILYIAGGRDNNQTILDMDYAKLEFLRKGKRNLTYKVYPDCSHYLEELIKDSEGKPVKVDRMDEIHQFAIDWANAN